MNIKILPREIVLVTKNHLSLIDWYGSVTNIGGNEIWVIDENYP